MVRSVHPGNLWNLKDHSIIHDGSVHAEHTRNVQKCSLVFLKKPLSWKHEAFLSQKGLERMEQLPLDTSITQEALIAWIEKFSSSTYIAAPVWAMASGHVLYNTRFPHLPFSADSLQ